MAYIMLDQTGAIKRILSELRLILFFIGIWTRSSGLESPHWASFARLVSQSVGDWRFFRSNKEVSLICAISKQSCCCTPRRPPALAKSASKHWQNLKDFFCCHNLKWPLFVYFNIIPKKRHQTNCPNIVKARPARICSRLN